MTQPVMRRASRPSSALGYEFHEEMLPISLLITRRTLTAEDVPGIFDYYRSLCRRGIRFVAVSDVRASLSMPDAKTRLRFAEESIRFEADARTWSLGAIVVVDSPLIRGALTAIEWLSRPPRPTRYFSDFNAAISRAAMLLESGNVALTPNIRRFLRDTRELHGQPRAG